MNVVLMKRNCDVKNIRLYSLINDCFSKRETRPKYSERKKNVQNQKWKKERHCHEHNKESKKKKSLKKKKQIEIDESKTNEYWMKWNDSKSRKFFFRLYKFFFLLFLLFAHNLHFRNVMISFFRYFQYERSFVVVVVVSFLPLYSFVFITIQSKFRSWVVPINK